MARCKAIDVELEPEECAHLMAMRLIRGAVAEDCDVSKEMLKHDGCYEMEDDVLSLNGDSEDEGELVHFACGLASGALKQAMQLDLAKASWAAVQENTADFHEVRGFRDEEEEDDDFQEVHNTETGEFEVLASQNLTGTVLEVENSPADQVEMLRQEARDLLLKAAGNGRLAAVFKQRSSKAETSEPIPSIPGSKAPTVFECELQPHTRTMHKISSAPTLKRQPSAQLLQEVGAPLEPFAQLKLAWYMAGSPSKSLRQKELLSLPADYRGLQKLHSLTTQGDFLPRCASLGSLKKALPPLRPFRSTRP
ncbi:unnamed protein product [Durusdinium trenchii]|uniref:Uncharacterized protein n=1 Tax=Durusdinium trenchii TaxID=1381693 RepID=A0ABP0PL53_9DINO